MIYFVKDEAYIKIGHTLGSFKNPNWQRGVKTRFKGLLSANPRPLELLGVIQGSLRRERLLHRLFASECHRSEWFHASQKLLSFIKRHAVVVTENTKAPLRGTTNKFVPAIGMAAINRIAVKVSCDPRTVMKVLRGDPVRGDAGYRAKLALIEAGLLQAAAVAA